jgi:hypothetical protein
MTDDQLKKKLDQICRELLPNPIIQEWRAKEEESKSNFHSDYGRFENQFKLYLGTIVEQCYALNFIAKHDWPDHRSLQYCLMVYNTKPLYSSFDRLSNGFIDDAVTLLRPVFETIIRIIYISCFPEDPYAVLVHKPPKGIRQFQINNFIEKDLGLSWLKDYALLSSFTHSNSLSVIERMMEHLNSNGSTPFDVLLDQNQGYKDVCINFIAFYQYCYMHFIRRLFSVKLKDKKELALWKLSASLESLRRQSLLRHPNPSKHFEKLINDFENLVELALRCDNGENWQVAWNDLRTGSKV